MVGMLMIPEPDRPHCQCPLCRPADPKSGIAISSIDAFTVSEGRERQAASACLQESITPPTASTACCPMRVGSQPF